jgi:hypothetical protein
MGRGCSPGLRRWGPELVERDYARRGCTGLGEAMPLFDEWCECEVNEDGRKRLLKMY